MASKTDQAIELDKQTRADQSNKDIIKKLGEEVVELTWGLARKDDKNIKEEIGDCALLLAKLMKNKFGDEFTLAQLAKMSAKKRLKRKTK